MALNERRFFTILDFLWISSPPAPTSEAHLATIESRTDQPPPGPAPRKPERNQPRFDVRGHLHRILGVDLTALPGFSAITAHSLYSEIGFDLSQKLRWSAQG